MYYTSRGFNGERLSTVAPFRSDTYSYERRMSFALYPSDAATAAPSDPPALRPAQPAPTLVEGQGCCQDKEEANLSKLGLRPHHPRQGEPEDLLSDAEKRCVTTSPTTIQHFTRATYSGSCTTVTGRSHTHCNGPRPGAAKTHCVQLSSQL